MRDGALLAKDHLFRLLDIDGVEVSEGERQRGEDQIPTLRLGKGANSVKLAIINVIAEF